MMRLTLASLAIMQCIFFGCATTSDTEPKKVLSSEERGAMLRNIARGAIHENDPTGALAVLIQSEQYDAESADLYHLKALAYFRKFEYEKAIDNARRAVEIEPNFSAARTTLGKLLLDSGRYDEAIDHLIAAAKDPLNREAYIARTNLGILYFRRGNYSKAKSNLDIAIRDGQASACVAHYFRGQLKFQNFEFKGAVRDFKKATLNQCTHYVDAHYAMGLALLRDKDFISAKKKLLEVTQLFPDSKYAEKAMEKLKEIP